MAHIKISPILAAKIEFIFDICTTSLQFSYPIPPVSKSVENHDQQKLDHFLNFLHYSKILSMKSSHSLIFYRITQMAFLFIFIKIYQIVAKFLRHVFMNMFSVHEHFYFHTIVFSDENSISEETAFI